MIVTAGKTNVSVFFYIQQDASGTSPGEPVTGLLFSDIETGGSASYARQGAARVDLTLITLASASAAHSDGGFILVDDTNMPGVYRCDYPDAAFATGVDQIICSLVVASANNATAVPIMVDITDVDLRDSVRGGMTALPNAAADGAGGLVISDAGGYDIDASATAVWAAATRTLSASTNLNDISLADIFTYVIENSETFEQQLRIMRAESAGKVSVSGATVTFRNAADDGDRITATTDSTGQRTAVTVDGT